MLENMEISLESAFQQSYILEQAENDSLMMLKNDLHGTYAYLDNIIICGSSKKEHDINLKEFEDAAKKIRIFYNDDKCIFKVTEISMLGYMISFNSIKPDPSRIESFLAIKPPNDMRSLRHCTEIFSYYSHWIPNFSTKIHPIIRSTSFPISKDAREAFEHIKQ